MYTIENVINDILINGYDIAVRKASNDNKIIVRKNNSSRVISIQPITGGLTIYIEDGSGMIAHMNYLNLFLDLIEIK